MVGADAPWICEGGGRAREIIDGEVAVAGFADHGLVGCPELGEVEVLASLLIIPAETGEVAH